MRHRKFVQRQRTMYSSKVMFTLFICSIVLMDNAIHYVSSQSLPSQAQHQARPSNSPPLSSEKYFGTPLGAIHSPGTVKGEVFIVDDSTLFLRGFSFPGSSYPFSFFHAGSSPGPDGTGFNIPDERGSTRPLGDYRDKDIVLRLPEGRSTRDIRWLSIWSRTIHANLGHVFIPINSVIPAPLELPPINGLGHGIRSGAVSIIDAQTILLTDFWYDGTGPSAYFWVTRGPRQSAQGLRLKDENDTPRPLRPYRGESFLIRLPDLKTVYDFDWFGVWSEEFQIDMGHFHLPQHVRVPPSSRMLGIKPEHKLNCEVLDDRRGFELRWVMDGDDIVMQLVAKLQPREYMAFGLSKDDHRSIMTGADAAVAWIDEAGVGHAVDYFLGSKEQCIGNRGSCPDLKHSGATDSITLLHSAVVNGFTMVTFKRPQLAVDELYDQHIYSDGQQGVIWSIGTLNSRNEAAYHNLRTIGNRYMDFARPPTWNCPRPDEALLSHRRFQRLSVAASSSKNQSQSPPMRASKPQVPAPQPLLQQASQPAPQESGTPAAESSIHESHQILPAWKVPVIRCPRERTLVAQIGPAGKARGYGAITGKIGRPIAWYINGLLVPELVLKRGQVYTFLIEGGDDMNSIGRRHPLYLTDNPSGGFHVLTNEERMRERVFAGVGMTANGTVAPTAEGRLCEWKEPAGIDANSFERFEDYRSTLRLDCQENGRPGILRFKADDKTPEIIYYQDFMHKNLGWKIRIVDECDDSKPTTSGQVLHTVAASMPRPVKVAPPNQIKNIDDHSSEGKISFIKHPTHVPQQQQHHQQQLFPNQHHIHNQSKQQKHFHHGQQQPQQQQQHHHLHPQHPLAHQLLGGTPMMFNRATFNLLPHTLLQPFKQTQHNQFNLPINGQRQYLPPIFPNQNAQNKQQQQPQQPPKQQAPSQIHVAGIPQNSFQFPSHPESPITGQSPASASSTGAVLASKYPMKKIGQQAQSQYYPNNNRRVHHSHPVPSQQSLRPLRNNKVPSMASGFVPISIDQQINIKGQQYPSQMPPQQSHHSQHPLQHQQQPQQQPQQHQQRPKQGYRYKIRKIGKPLKHRGQHAGDFFRLSAIKPTTPKVPEQTTTIAPSSSSASMAPSSTIVTQHQTTVTLSPTTTTTTPAPSSITTKLTTTTVTQTVTTESPITVPTTIPPTTVSVQDVETTTIKTNDDTSMVTTTPSSVSTSAASSPSSTTRHNTDGTTAQTTEMPIISDMSSEESQRRLVMSTLNGFKSISEAKPGSFDNLLSQTEQQAATNPDDSILSDVMRMISNNLPHIRQKQRHLPQYIGNYRTLEHNLF